jgi:hypothetical protein
MRAKVESIRANGRSCEARSDNGILFVFAMPAGADIRLGHLLELDTNVIDAPQIVRNISTGQDLKIVLERDNIHDLQLPLAHGTSRFPSKERLGGA